MRIDIHKGQKLLYTFVQAMERKNLALVEIEGFVAIPGGTMATFQMVKEWADGEGFYFTLKEEKRG